MIIIIIIIIIKIIIIINDFYIGFNLEALSSIQINTVFINSQGS